MRAAHDGGAAHFGLLGTGAALQGHEVHNAFLLDPESRSIFDFRRETRKRLVRFVQKMLQTAKSRT